MPLPAPRQDAVLNEVAGELRELSSLSTPLLRAKVTLTGNSDAAGEGTFNLALSVARAEAVRALLPKSVASIQISSRCAEQALSNPPPPEKRQPPGRPTAACHSP